MIMNNELSLDDELGYVNANPLRVHCQDHSKEPSKQEKVKNPVDNLVGIPR